MKKYRLFSGALALVLALQLSLTTTVFADTVQETTEPVTHMVEGAGDATSELLDALYVEATAAILVDDITGDILYSQNAYERRYPASITKVMTALLTVEAIARGELSVDDIIVVGSEVMHEVGAYSSTQNIKEGEEMRLEDVLYCALTASANEACNVLAQAVSGTVSDFVALMNQRAQELGMTDTHFENTHGYHNDNHYTTAYDIVLMCSAAMDYELFRTVVSTSDYVVPATNLYAERHLWETNALISGYRYTGYLYSNATGIKTGSTTEAGLCLASSASEEGRDLIAVVLGCVREEGATGSSGYTQFSESVRLLEWGFDNTAVRSVLDSTGYHFEIPVTLSDEANYVGIEPVGSLSAMMPNDLDISRFQQEVQLIAASVEAPVTKGQVLGTITVTNGEDNYGTLDLVAVNDVSRSELLYRLDQAETFFDQLWVRILLVVVLLLVGLVALRWMLFGKRRRRRTYNGRRR